MSKYSFEFKKAYLNGESEKKYIAEKLGIPAPSNKKFEDEGLKSLHQNNSYSFD